MILVDWYHLNWDLIQALLAFLLLAVIIFIRILRRVRRWRPVKLSHVVQDSLSFNGLSITNGGSHHILVSDLQVGMSEPYGAFNNTDITEDSTITSAMGFFIRPGETIQSPVNIYVSSGKTITSMILRGKNIRPDGWFPFFINYYYH